MIEVLNMQEKQMLNCNILEIAFIEAVHILFGQKSQLCDSASSGSQSLLGIQ